MLQTKVKEYVLQGFPDKYKIPDSLKSYWNFRGKLCDGKPHSHSNKSSNTIIIEIGSIDKIHQGHQGIVKCRARVKESIWWPGFSREIQDVIQGC